MDQNLYYITREVNKSKTVHTWTCKIPDFMWLLNNQTNRKIITKESKTHEDGDIEEFNFQIMIRFVGYKNELIEIFYKSKESVFIKVGLRFKTWVDRGRYVDQSYTSLPDKPYQWIQNNKWNFIGMQYKSQLHDENKLYKDKFELEFEFNMCHNKTEVKPYHHNKEEQLGEPHCDLMNNLSSLLENMTLSDVTVKSLEGDIFPAHKILLIARSTVFKAHFEHNTVENITNVIESPYETDVLKNIISYIYTDNAPNIDELSRKLLSAADFYELNGLKKLCETALEKELTVDNAIETLDLANLHRALYLKTKTLEFIKDGLAAEITTTKGWQTLQSTEALLVKSIYEFIVRK